MVTPIEFLGIDAEITGSAYLPSKVAVTPVLPILSDNNNDGDFQGKSGGAGAKASGGEGAKPSVFQVRIILYYIITKAHFIDSGFYISRS